MRNKLTLYDLLRVDSKATVDQIRRSYRVLAHKYHPDSEGGNVEMSRLITDAWKTLHDDVSRAAYDKSLHDESSRDYPRTVAWSREEIRYAILQVLLAASKKRPGGSVSKQMLIDILAPAPLELELGLSQLQGRALLEVLDKRFRLTSLGLDYIRDHAPD